MQQNSWREGGLSLIALASIPWFVRFLRGRDSSRFEEHLGWFFRRRGPLVAIGRPGERMGTPGAARIYVADDEWQDFVLKMQDRSQIVLIQVAPTAGTWWEFIQCIRRVPPTRLLLLLSAVRGSQQRYEELRLMSWDVLPRPLPPALGEGAFVRFDAAGYPCVLPARYRPRVLWSLVDSIVDWRRSLAPFLEHVSEPSRPPAPRSAAEVDKTLPTPPVLQPSVAPPVAPEPSEAVPLIGISKSPWEVAKKVIVTLLVLTSIGGVMAALLLHERLQNYPYMPAVYLSLVGTIILAIILAKVWKIGE
jgi:hypothetical protein